MLWACSYSDTSKRIKLEQDVFSFGVVMLETITGLAPTHMTTLEDHSERSLLSSVSTSSSLANELSNIYALSSSICFANVSDASVNSLSKYPLVHV